MSRFRSLETLLAGRWQVPLGLLAIASVGVTAYRLQPASRPIDFPTVQAHLFVLRQAGALREAADAAANLLDHVPQPSQTETAWLHSFIAETAYEVEKLRRDPIPANVSLIIEHHAAAEGLGREPTPEERLHVAKALEWLREPRAAIENYRSILLRGAGPDVRRIARDALIALLDGRPSADQERRRLLDAQLNEDDVTSTYLWSAMQRAMRAAIDRGEPAVARGLFERHGDKLRRSDLQGGHGYLLADLLVAEGRTLEADALVVAVEDWFAGQGPTRELFDAGLKPVLLRILRGRIHLAEQRPQEALQCFEDVLARESSRSDEYLSAAALEARALAALERHDVAMKRLGQSALEMTRGAERLPVAQPRLARVAHALFEDRYAAGDLRRAVEYLSLALGLLPEDEADVRRQWARRLGETCVACARVEQDVEAEEELHLRAAQSFECAAGLCEYDEDEKADLTWAGAQAYDQLGRVEDVQRLLSAFLAERVDDPRLPMAMLQLGRVRDAAGDAADALRWYERVATSYPKLPEAARATLLRVRLLMRPDVGRSAEAERAVLDLLESDLLGPESDTFRDAMHTLADLLYEQRRWAAAIRRFEDCLLLYPDHEDTWRIRFLRADAYRRSALELRESDGDEAAMPRRAAEARERFARAAELFGEFLSADSRPGDRLVAGLYERLAMLHRADCLFELNQPDSLREALAAYRQAAARYARHPTALVCQVRIASIHLRQDRGAEAARAVEHARWMLPGIPEQAFAEPGVSSGRSDWEQYLAALSGSGLFRDLLASAP
jgi:tetratricopeptide (TPR) repeat protein